MRLAVKSITEVKHLMMIIIILIIIIIIIIRIFTQDNPSVHCIVFNGVLHIELSQFCGGRKQECPEETVEVRLRSTENSIHIQHCSRGGRRD